MSAKKIVFLIILVLVLTLGVVGVSHTSAAPAAAFPTSRDPIYWPGPANGIWNMPIHNNAVYVPAGIGNHMPSAAGPTTDPEILILSPNSPLKNLVENDAGWDGGKRCTSLTGATLLTGVPIPANFTTGPEYAGSTPNNSGAILMADGVTVYETQPLHVCSVGGTVTSQYMWAPYNIKTGAGILGSHGGSGMTALGGSVRYGELMPGSVIRHAMKMNFYALYNYSWTGGGYRWPAPYADSYASAALWGGSVPAMREGSLLALKPDFNINSLQTGPAKIIAQAAMDYGIYAVDDTYWDVFALDVEEGPLGSVGTQFQSQYGYGLDDGPLMNCTATTDACKYSKDMWTILSSLNVIDNNTATTIGGGLNSDTVNRRAPMAPPFIGQATATAVATSAGPTATKTKTPTPNAAVNWKIMPIGDSITCGDDNMGYRGPLYDKLVAGGYTTTYVGNNGDIANGGIPPMGSTNINVTWEDGTEGCGDLYTGAASKNYEGHGGFQAGQVFGQVGYTDHMLAQMLVRDFTRFNPDIVIIHLGTNDLWGGWSEHGFWTVAQSSANVLGVVDQVHGYNANTMIYVTEIGRTSSGQASETETISTAIGNGVATRKAQGWKIEFIGDLYANLTTANVPDGTHPNAAGYGKFATTIYNHLKPYLDAGGGGATNTPAGPTATRTSTPAAGPTATKTATPIPGAGSLSGAAANNSTAVNLTTQGTTDWAHFYTTVNRKSGGGSLITQSVIGGTATGYTDDARRISWTGGAPTASSTNNRNGLYISGVNNGFQLVVPADTTPRTLKVYVGGWNSTGKINAHLSDGSAVDYNFTGAAFGASYDYAFTLTYSAASAGQTLTVKWTQNAGTGNVALNGAALSGGGAGPTNTPVPPTVTKTNTPVGPTATRTNTPVGPTATPSGTWTLKDDNVAGWTWSGWTQYSDAALQGGTAHGSGTAGHYGQYTFTGTSVEVYAWKGLGGGTLQVYIDGVSQGTFSQSNGTEVFKQLIYSNTTLTSGSHTVKIVGGIPAGADWAMVDYIRYK